MSSALLVHFGVWSCLSFARSQFGLITMHQGFIFCCLASTLFVEESFELSCTKARSLRRCPREHFGHFRFMIPLIFDQQYISDSQMNVSSSEQFDFFLRQPYLRVLKTQLWCQRHAPTCTPSNKQYLFKHFTAREWCFLACEEKFTFRMRRHSSTNTFVMFALNV